jgi:geranylgeranyl diphosphate synthase type I
MTTDFTALLEFLKRADRDVLGYLRHSPSSRMFAPQAIKEAAWSYVSRPGKRLRPAVLMMACGSVGGEIEKAVPAAAAVEVFHTWTLVHDDLIDNDDLRRGSPTVHVMAESHGKEEWGLDAVAARRYGRDIAVLAGDVQHGWATALLAETGLELGVDPAVVLSVVRLLASSVVSQLVCGETLDVEFSLLDDRSAGVLDERSIIEMLTLKTGVLYEFAGTAGAMIGKSTTDREDPLVLALGSFCANCGTAFQLQDDILGVLGEEKDTGKPFGSDIREGKQTVIVHEALMNADEAQRADLMTVLGNEAASDDQVRHTVSLMEQLGGIDRTRNLALSYVESALGLLEPVPDSDYKSLLQLWAGYVIDRRY